MNREQAIEAARQALDEEATVAVGDGHSGVGWYGWSAEYPDTGSVFLGAADLDSLLEATRNRETNDRAADEIAREQEGE